jgi:tetratricopeptide (TPR) repeat protein
MNKADDNSDQHLLPSAMQAHRDGELDMAADLYDEFLKQDPGHAQALRLRGSLARDLGQLEASRAWLEGARAAAPEQAEPCNELALTLLALGQLPAAEAALRAALKLDPDSPRALANLGALAQYRGRLPEAIDCAKRYLALQPADLEVRCNLATALADAGRGEEALQACELALEQAAGHPFVLATQGSVLVALQDFAAAVPVLELATGRNPDDDLALTNLAQAYFSLQRDADACHVLQRALRINPNNARAASDLALMSSVGGDSARAQEVCSEFLQRHPGERLVLAAQISVLQQAGHCQAASELLDLEGLIEVTQIAAPPGFADTAAFNTALIANLKQNASLLAEPASKSTRGGRQTGELDLDSDPALRALGKMLSQAVADYATARERAGQADHPLMAYASTDPALRVWGTVLTGGGHQGSHLHPLGFVSGVYYLQIPEEMSVADSQAGWLEFGSPPVQLGTDAAGERRRLEPVVGQLVLFPSYFRHATLPFSAAGERISIAFDAVPQTSPG